MAPLLQQDDRLGRRILGNRDARIRALFEVVGCLPVEQPLCVLTGAGVLVVANRPLSELLGMGADELIDADWEDLMPS
jgi:hypothetical protein